jgi:hypothetical protein
MTDSTTPDLVAVMSRLHATHLPFKTKLADRLANLATLFSDDYDGRELSTRSVTGLIDFLEASPQSGYPDLTLTPAGDCYAEWRGPQGRKVAIEFRDSGEARYLLFRPNPRHPQRIDRLTGTTTIDALAETMAPLRGLAA